MIVVLCGLKIADLVQNFDNHGPYVAKVQTVPTMEPTVEPTETTESRWRHSSYSLYPQQIFLAKKHKTNVSLPPVKIPDLTSLPSGDEELWLCPVRTIK